MPKRHAGILFVALISLFAPPAAKAGFVQQSAFYANVGLGAAHVANNDITAYYSGPGVNMAPIGGSFYPLLDLNAGWQFEAPFALELGLLDGPIRNYKVIYSQGSLSKTDSITWDDYTVYVMPSYHTVLEGFSSRKPMVATLGARLGYSFLTGTETVSANYTSATNSRDDDASAPYYAVVARLEQLLGRHFSLGLELGYASNVFTTIHYSNSTLNPFSGTLTNGDNSNTQADNSGVFFKLVLGFWARPPWAPPALVAAHSPGNAPDSLGLTDEPTAKAKARVEAGNRFLHAQLYSDAESAYRQAADIQPDYSAAWQGLGNALYYQGRKRDALEAYHNALNLSPNNAALRAFVDKLTLVVEPGGR